MSSPGAAAAPALLELRGAGARAGGRWIVRDVSLCLRAGETLAVVGPSGAGKSTLARLALGLIPAAEGEVWVEGQNLTRLAPGALRRRRPRWGFVQQDPEGALDPTQSVAAIVCEGIELHGQRPPWHVRGARREAWRRQRAAVWLERVGLDAALAERPPRELSGGQRQRVALARALAPAPVLLVADEPVSALDTSTGAAVLAQLRALQRAEGMACLLVAHHLPQVAGWAERLAVLAPSGDGGHIVEQGPTAEVLARPLAPLTRDLLAACLPWPHFETIMRP
ncbi:MAG: ATP-binding cassette domain-containing protein [Terriglobales bacterium]